MDTLIKPFPTLGEIVRFIASELLDTRSSAKDIACDLDRLAREDHFDLTQVASIIEQVIEKPLHDLHPGLAELVSNHVKHILGEYSRLVVSIPVDALSRDAVFPVLLEDGIVPSLANVLLQTRSLVPYGPVLPKLLDESILSIKSVFNWFLSELGPYAKAADKAERMLLTDWYAGEPKKGAGRKLDRDNLARTLRSWLDGECPNLQSIKLLCKSAKDKAPDSFAETIDALAIWLIVARTLDKGQAAINKIGISVDLKAATHKHLLHGTPPVDIGKRLSLLNLEKGQPFFISIKDLYFRCSKLCDLREPKPKDGMKQSGKALRLLDQEFPKSLPNHARYMLIWLDARYQVLAQREKKALMLYAEAFKQATYCAGVNQKKILHEILVLAAYLDNKVQIRNHYRWACAFKLFEGETSAPQGWEIDRLVQAYAQTFPEAGRYPDTEASRTTVDKSRPPFLALCEEDMSAWEPDLRHPNRVINIDGQGIRKPQLAIAAWWDRLDALEALLQREADVNQLTDRNESALFLALGTAVESGERGCMDRLLQEPHCSETLNAVTQIKQATCLQRAIELADPIVVTLLLVKGANVDQICSEDKMTPLYYCIQLIYKSILPEEYSLQVKAMSPSKQQLRRSGALAANAGAVFDTEHSKVYKQIMRDPRKRQIYTDVIKYYMKKDRRDPDALRQVAEILLNHGAKPNEVEQTTSYTPLQYAAQLGDVSLFNLLESQGGQRDIPLNMNGRNYSCLQIASGYRRTELVNYLSQTPPQ